MKQHIDSNFNFLWCGERTNVGQVRKANEDSNRIFEVANMKVFVVCDGMGGHVGGKMASETAITAIHNFFLNNITLDPREAIYNSIVAANEAILDKARQQPELAGMGSTCVMLVVTSDGKAYYGHVGDSRIYIVANHKIKQLTEDHSVVYEMFKAGVIKTREEMERHPRKNEITNALGLPNMQPPTVCREPIEPEAGNCFLLCSDGLTGMVSDDRIQRIICKHEINIQVRADELVKTANDNGGVDNITVELVEFTVGTQQIGGDSRGEKFFAPTGKKMLLFGLPVLVILGGLAWLILTEFFTKPDVPVGGKENNVTTDTLKTESGQNGTIPEIIRGSTIKPPLPKTDKVCLDTVEVLLDDSIVYALKKDIIVTIPDSIKLVSANAEASKANTSQLMVVHCYVSTDNKLVLNFKQPDFKNPVKVTVETAKRVYRFIIPVKMPGMNDPNDTNSNDTNPDSTKTS
jgi:protein phosphatase